MIYRAPELSGLDEQVLGEIQELRDDLRFHLVSPRRWYGTLSRVMMARAVQASTSIEGYHSTVDETAAIIDDEETPNVDHSTRMAVVGYRNAMTYVLQLTRPPRPVGLRTDNDHIDRPHPVEPPRPERPRMDASLLKALHFMMVGHDLSANPGQWRPGTVWVQDGAGNAVYEAPDRDVVEPLVDQLVAVVNEEPDPAVVAAAMAHLNLTLIHPFSDGNGRMARCLQSFVLGCADSRISPEFASIEAYLGRNTGTYYRALTDTAAGSWSPERSARPWMEFCLTAHYHQAVSLRRRIDRTAALWDRCEQAAARGRLPDRTIDALMHSARDWPLNRSRYITIVRSASGEPIGEAMATRDLAAMVAAGLLEPVGEKRGRHYLPSESLRALERAIRDMQPARPAIDPYGTPDP